MNTKQKYFIYARKSSESDEKQVQSIDDQVLIMDGIARNYGLKIVDTITESKSAKEPHGRPEFEKMMERIKKGEAQGLLVWKIDRLSRNPIDSATIQWLLQKEIIACIRTPDREYRPEDNALLLSVESSMANQYIRDLSKNVKRGLKSKLDKGWMPCTAPLGYLNTKTEIRGENYIIKDPDRFPLMRRAWDLMLSGNYLAAEIRDKMNNEWGLRTRSWKKRGCRPISRSTIYRIFTNAFYAGLIPYKGLYIQGKHEPMITLEEFDRVQLMLGREGNQRPRRYEYAYTGKIICCECGGLVSATYKEKLLRSSGKLGKYILYYCICARKYPGKCAQAYYTNANLIDQCIEKKIDSLAIMAEFKDWALEVIRDLNTDEIVERTKIYENQQKAVNDLQKQIDNLTQLRLKELVEDDEYTKERTRLKNELTVMRTKIKDTEERADSWVELTEKTFEFAYYAHKAFLFGDAETKREILSTISRLNCTLKGGKLLIEATEWLQPIEKGYPAIKAKIQSFEPEKLLTETGRNEVIASIRPEMRGRRDLNPQPSA